ncbi:MAG: S-adenosylmethionine/S-adenosylhomocysteine transporter [Chlamydiia bacterium]|nr:S-adenosylmethionine/S-adenosylhomocysteine transporter [Chlamydiia bacterium]
MLLAGAILLVFLFFKRKTDFKIKARQYLSLCILGFFSIYLTNICEFWGLQYLSAAKTCFIYSLSPFFAVLFSYIHFKEKLTVAKCVGLLIGFIGFIPVLMLQSGSEGLLSISSFLSWPDLAIAAAALFSVYGWVLLRLLVKNDEVSPIMANGTSMVFGGLLALGHSFFVDAWSPTPIAGGNFMPLFGGVLAMTFISNIICFNLYGYMLKRFTATFLSFAGLLSPVFASINSWIILGEKPSYIIFLSTGVVCLGLWIVYRSELKQGYIRKRSKDEISS